MSSGKAYEGLPGIGVKPCPTCSAKLMRIDNLQPTYRRLFVYLSFASIAINSISGAEQLSRLGKTIRIQSSTALSYDLISTGGDLPLVGAQIAEPATN
jgi:hypothetical protein